MPELQEKSKDQFCFELGQFAVEQHLVRYQLKVNIMTATPIILIVLFCVYTLGCWIYSTMGEEQEGTD